MRRLRDKFVGITRKKIDKLEDRHKKVLHIFSGYQFDRILDVGCGDGNFCVSLKKACKAKEVYGIEISPKAVEMAKKNGVKAFQLDMDKEDFPFEDNYFDAVFAGEIIEHLYDPDHLLEEVNRVVRPGTNLFVLTTPNLACWQNRVSLLFGFQPYLTSASLRYRIGHISGDSELLPEEVIEGRKHVSVFTLRALLKLIEIYQFGVIEVKGSPIRLAHYMKFNSLLAKITNRIDTMISLITPSLSPQIIVMCKKLTQNES